MKKYEIGTPALLIDREIMMDNIMFMQEYANKNKVNLRPHTKTHKMPELALIQRDKGAKGITVAKTDEAEVMIEHGLKDVFIANEIVGNDKLEKITRLMDKAEVSFGIDCVEHVDAIEEVFKKADKVANVLIEIEVGENRSGIIEEEDFVNLLNCIKTKNNVHLKGIFSHDGDSYGAEDYKELEEIFYTSQKRTLRFAEIAEQMDMKLEVISIGSTPSLMHDMKILEGVTEIRPGTYILMDASQGNAIKSYERCAATVLTTVMSRPTDERVITDVGAKGITAQTRSKGICATKGLGYIKGFDYDVNIFDVYDEHAIIYNKQFREDTKIGQKVEIIPNHICPVCNLHDTAYLVSGDEVVKEIEIACRGKLK